MVFQSKTDPSKGFKPHFRLLQEVSLSRFAWAGVPRRTPSDGCP